MGREPWEIELERLREDYRRELPEKLAGLEAALREAFRTAGRGRLEAAHRAAHSLKGSSGSHGFDEACRALQEIEDALGDLLDRAPGDPIDRAPGDPIDRAPGDPIGAAPDPAATEIADLRSELEAALARARASLGPA